MIELYDITAHLNGSPAGSPVYIDHFSLAVGGSGQTAPDGCAALVGFRSDYGVDVEFAPNTRPRSRDRNRFYLGPLLMLALTVDAQNRCILYNATAHFVADLSLALTALQASSGTSDRPVWVQWSPTNAAVKDITHIWVDDAPRYQRRRSDTGPEIVVF